MAPGKRNGSGNSHREEESANERTALLPGAAVATGQGPSHSFHNDLQPHEDPGWIDSLKNLLFGNWVNVLLIAVPFSFVSHFAGWGSTADFIISFIAIVPLAALLGDATEQVSLRLGQTIGGLLNATFGNAVEGIVGVIALTQGELRIVQTSMLGSILSNILLVLGCSFLAGGLKFKESTFQQTAAATSSSIIVLAVAALVIPAAFVMSSGERRNGPEVLLELANKSKQDKEELHGLLTISRGTSIVLIVCYVAYLYFQLKSHAYLYEAEEDDNDEEAKMNVTVATTALLGVTVVTAFCADYLVGAIDEFANDFGIPKPFIGLVMLPIVGNAAEHVTSVWMALKHRTELVIGVCVGSSIQIALGMLPLLTIIGWAIGQNLTLYFESFETAILLISVLLVNMLLVDGKSNWLEGTMLIALYIIIALAVWQT